MDLVFSKKIGENVQKRNFDDKGKEKECQNRAYKYNHLQLLSHIALFWANFNWMKVKMPETLK